MLGVQNNLAVFRILGEMVNYLLLETQEGFLEFDLTNNFPNSTLRYWTTVSHINNQSNIRVPEIGFYYRVIQVLTRAKWSNFRSFLAEGF